VLNKVEKNYILGMTKNRHSCIFLQYERTCQKVDSTKLRWIMLYLWSCKFTGVQMHLFANYDYDDFYYGFNDQ